MKINNQDYHGLSTAEVNQRISNGKINTVDNKITKSYKQIFLNNTITFFNILNAALLGLVLFVGSYKNTLFILVIITYINVRLAFPQANTCSKRTPSNSAKSRRHAGRPISSP